MSKVLSKRSKSDLAKYDPDKGLKSIAVMEAAEKHFARAKDSTKLEQAIRAKLEAQAEFVFWWDNHVEKTQGARGEAGPGRGRKGKRRSRPTTPFMRAGKDGIPERYVIDRWRKKLNDPDKFEATYAEALERYRTILEFDSKVHVSQRTGYYEWYTSAEYIEAARKVLGSIDLDPASTEKANEVVRAAQIFTVDDDALNEQWDGRVWMNPPYSQPLIAQFCEKLAMSFKVETVISACVLVNNATETEWFRSLINVASAICFPAGRVKFWSPQKREPSVPLQGQAVLYLGDNIDLFFEQFAKFGFLVTIKR